MIMEKLRSYILIKFINVYLNTVYLNNAQVSTTSTRVKTSISLVIVSANKPCIYNSACLDI